MNRPNREQIEQARSLLLDELGSEELAATMGAPVFDAVSVLLAATAEPNEGALAAEAQRVYQRPNLDDVPGTYWQWYAAGARREGAR